MYEGRNGNSNVKSVETICRLMVPLHVDGHICMLRDNGERNSWKCYGFPTSVMALFNTIVQCAQVHKLFVYDLQCTFTSGVESRLVLWVCMVFNFTQ